MTTPRDPEALLTAYLAGGMEVLPDRVVESVLDEVHRTRQLTVLGPRRSPISRTTLAAAAVVAALALGAALFVVSGGPSPEPSEEPSASLQGVVPPSSTPSAPSAAPTASPSRVRTGSGSRLGRWARLSMTTPRCGSSMAGCSFWAGPAMDPAMTSAELYDPLTGTWTATGSMANPREGDATLLHDGRVLVGDVEAPKPG